MVASAKTTKDLLEIEEQIRQLQEDIESNASLLKSLADQVDFSTLNVSIYYAETGNINNPNPFISEVGDALSDGWGLIKNCTLGIIAIWPILLMGIIGFLGWKKYRKRKSQ